MIYVLYGQPGSGKTTLSELLRSHIQSMPMGCDPAVIDGDEFRKLFTNKDYSKKGRYQNIKNANAIATYINKVEDRGVIVALVNPYKSLRQELKINNFAQVKEVLLVTKRQLRKEYHCLDFEVGNPDFKLNTDTSIETTWNFLRYMVMKD